MLASVNTGGWCIVFRDGDEGSDDRRALFAGRNRTGGGVVGSADMTRVHFWLARWEHECCGDRRRVGETITVNLSFEGEVEPGEGPDLVEAIADGSMVMVGATRNADGSQPGVIVTAGPVEFGFQGRLATDRVRCRGRLWEVRHGNDVGTGEVTGRIVSMKYQPGPRRERPGGSDRHPGEPVVIYNTDQLRQQPSQSGDFWHCVEVAAE